MGDHEAGLERNGNSIAGIIVRCIGTAVLGASVSTAGWMYYKFEEAAGQRDSLRQRLSKLETAVEKFHSEFYRWQTKRERVDEKQWDQINRMKP